VVSALDNDADILNSEVSNGTKILVFVDDILNSEVSAAVTTTLDFEGITITLVRAIFSTVESSCSMELASKVFEEYSSVENLKSFSPLEYLLTFELLVEESKFSVEFPLL